MTCGCVGVAAKLLDTLGAAPGQTTVFENVWSCASMDAVPLRSSLFCRKGFLKQRAPPFRPPLQVRKFAHLRAAAIALP